MKKYEILKNNKKIGLITFFQKPMQKVIKNSINTLIDVTTNSGFKIKKTKNIDLEIQNKIAFIELHVNQITDLDKKAKILHNYSKIQSFAQSFSPESEYYDFYTEEELQSKKALLLKYLEGIQVFISCSLDLNKQEYKEKVK